VDKRISLLARDVIAALPSVVPVELPTEVPVVQPIVPRVLGAVEAAVAGTSGGQAKEVAKDEVVEAPVADVETRLIADVPTSAAVGQGEAMAAVVDVSIGDKKIAQDIDTETASTVETLVELEEKDFKAIKNRVSSDAIVAIVETSEDTLATVEEVEIGRDMAEDQGKPEEVDIETSKGDGQADTADAVEVSKNDSIAVVEDAETKATAVESQVQPEEVSVEISQGDDQVDSVNPIQESKTGEAVLGETEIETFENREVIVEELDTDKSHTVEEATVAQEVKVEVSSSEKVAAEGVDIQTASVAENQVTPKDADIEITKGDEPVISGAVIETTKDRGLIDSEGLSVEVKADEQSQLDGESWYHVHYDTVPAHPAEPKGKEIELVENQVEHETTANIAEEPVVAESPEDKTGTDSEAERAISQPEEAEAKASEPDLEAQQPVEPPSRPQSSGYSTALILRPASAIFNLCPLLGGSAAVVDSRPATAVPFSKPQQPRSQPVGTTGFLNRHDYKVPLQDALLGYHTPRSAMSSASSSASSRPVTAHGLPDPPPRRASERGEAGQKRDDPKAARRQQPATSSLPGFMIFAAGVTLATSVFRRGR